MMSFLVSFKSILIKWTEKKPLSKDKGFNYLLSLNYLISTVAPAATNFSLIDSASSGDTFSLTAAGTPSTNFLASTNPKPVISRTALITATLVPPTSVNVTLTSVGSAAAPASAPATTATGAAAVTSNFSSIAFTKSFNSKIVAYSK